MSDSEYFTEAEARARMGYPPLDDPQCRMSSERTVQILVKRLVVEAHKVGIYEQALKRIATADYRGNRPVEASWAEAALAEGEAAGNA